MSALDSLARRWWGGELGATGTALDVALAPAEAAYRVGTGLRNAAFERGVLHAARADITVISVGNIAVGGSGKTPFTSWLARRLAERGESPAIAHGGYADDEPELLRSWTPDIPVIVDRDRRRAAAHAQQLGASVLVLDDAFQHRRLHRDLDIVLVSVDRWTERRRLLPRGPWREPASALSRADLVVAIRKAAGTDGAARAADALGAVSGRPVVRAWLEARSWERAGEPDTAPQGSALLVAAVADAAAFTANAIAAGAYVGSEIIFPDHHMYDAVDAERIRLAAGDRPIVTTAKDWIKLRHHLDPRRTWVLTQDVVIESGLGLLDAALDRSVHRA